jgi:hypothetical protein
MGKGVKGCVITTNVLKVYVPDADCVGCRVGYMIVNDNYLEKGYPGSGICSLLSQGRGICRKFQF